jgi:hypothetical protein
VNHLHRNLPSSSTLQYTSTAAAMASPAVRKAISEAALKYQKPEGKAFEYGTAGVSSRPRLLNQEMS